MKFAKELEDDAVAEWRPQYLDYKGAKKKLKALGRARKNIERSSPNLSRAPGQSTLSSLRDAPVRNFLHQTRGSAQPLQEPESAPVHRVTSHQNHGDVSPRARPIPIDERSPLRGGEVGRDGQPMTRYGSIIGSPASDAHHNLEQAPSLELPDPALTTVASRQSRGSAQFDAPSQPPATQLAHVGDAYRVSQLQDDPLTSPSNANSTTRFLPRRINSNPDGRPFFMRRMFTSTGAMDGKAGSGRDIALEAYNELDFRRAEFFNFLDKELAKIEAFYKEKEDQATERLNILRKQLHVLRNRRMEELEAHQAKHHPSHVPNGEVSGRHSEDLHRNDDSQLRHPHHENPIMKSIDFAHDRLGEAIERVRTGHVGKTSKAMEQLGTPEMDNQNWQPVASDYQRRPIKKADITYRAAKRKLKIALAEYYRGLELLKSYALVNAKGFRKINKKYDKTDQARVKLKYLSESVNKSHFVQSDAVDKNIQAVEDLYARYFERGHHKVAVGKLRRKIAKAGDFTFSVFQTGVFVTGGAFLAVEGLVYGLMQDLGNADVVVRTHASYLLQLYAGYFLCLVLMGLFCLDAGLFSKAKVNYQFIFEFDSRNTLDWKQLCQLPAFLFFLMGLIMFLNFFIRAGGETMYIYWPVVLIGLSAIILFLPFRILYYKARLWFGYSCWRLLCSGLYSVEFRDFFLGDMFCSLTYAMGNIELFFCLYAQHPPWSEPPQCNSSNSRLLGFFTALPGIWRLFQCLRRYHDTGDWFPHLANGAKYTCTILYYVTLSLYRFNHGTGPKAAFIFFAALNASYCTFWDLVMDWSLQLSPRTIPPLLRPTLGLRRMKWLYYVAIVIDPIIRFNWILYAVFTEDTQHSTAISFLVAITEVFRRGLWSIFRIENEHCTNVGRFRASRDTALPYEIEGSTSKTSLVSGPGSGADTGQATPTQTTSQRDGQPPSGGLSRIDSRATGRDLEQGNASGGDSVRRRNMLTDSPVARSLRQIGSTMLSAHARDYERRKPAQEFHATAEESDEGDSDNEPD